MLARPVNRPRFAVQRSGTTSLTLRAFLIGYVMTAGLLLVARLGLGLALSWIEILAMVLLLPVESLAVDHLRRAEQQRLRPFPTVIIAFATLAALLALVVFYSGSTAVHPVLLWSSILASGPVYLLLSGLGRLAREHGPK